MSGHQITFSSELMQNYLQAEIMRPEKGFQALQTGAGNALLFSIGTDDALYVTVENPTSRQGWARANLSVARAAADFADDSGVVCKDFTVAQRTDGAIHLAMVLGDAQGNDRLYLCLGNSNSDTSWIDNPNWVAYDYDDPDHRRPKLTISDVFISEAADGEFIVVDVIRDPDSATALVFRYYLDTFKENGYAWHAHDVAIDLEAGHYISCLGRKGNQESYPVDGIYTAGQVGDRAQLIYAPLYNVFDTSQAPNPDRLTLPTNLIPSAIAACRNADNTSDLYAVAGNTLFHFAAANQGDGAVAVAVAQNDLFAGVRNLFAFDTGEGSVMVWGLNADDQIFYTTCPQGQQESRAAWSYPLPIMSGVEQLSPFVNRAYSANSFFAHTGENKLIKAVKSPHTTMWNRREITLPPPMTTTPAQKYSSYTTQILVHDENNLPLGGVPISISASNVVSVHINHLYYVLSPTPIHVQTDPFGSLIMVEGVHTLAGTRYTIEIEGATVTINPMDKAFQKAMTLNSAGALQQATLPGTARRLVPPDAGDDDLRQVATGLDMLSQAYTSLSASAGAAFAAAPAVHFQNLEGTLVDVGDLFSWMAHEVESEIGEVTHWIEQLADGVWHIVVAIAGEVYRAALDVVEKVVEAAVWVFNKIKVAIEDLIHYLEFLFEFEDMQRAQQVLKNLIKVYLHYQADQIEVFRHQLDGYFDELEAAIGKWAGVDFSGFGDDANKPISGQAEKPREPSAPGSMMSHHFSGNAENASSNSTALTPPAEPVHSVFDELVEAVDKEGEILKDTFDLLLDVGKEIATLPLAEVLKKVAAILANAGLSSVQNVMDTLFDILYDLAIEAIDLLDTKIHIPVISDILNAFGVPDFSILDILCWVAAAPATIAYKLFADEAPFPDDEVTQFLIEATDYQAMVDRLRQPDVPAMPTRSAGFSIDFLAGENSTSEPPAQEVMTGFTLMTRGPEQTAEDAAQQLEGDYKELGLPGKKARVAFIVLHFGSVALAGVAGILYNFEALKPDLPIASQGSQAAQARPGGVLASGAGATAAAGAAPAGFDWLATFAALSSLGAGITKEVANGVASYGAIEAVAFSAVSMSFAGINFLTKIVLEVLAKTKFTIALISWRRLGAIVDVFLVVPAFVMTIIHIIAIISKGVGGSDKYAPADRSAFRKSVAMASLDEAANISSYVSRIAYLVAVMLPEDPDSETAKLITVIVMDVATGAAVVTQTAEAIVACTI